MPVGIEDVAQAAGVSVATVSRALRGLPGVAPATRQRVQEAARSLRYVADPHASRLALGRSATIGLVLPLIGRWYYAQMFSGIAGTCRQADYDVLPFLVPTPAARKEFVQRCPFVKRVEALVVVDLPLDDQQLDRLRQTGVEIVLVGACRKGFACLDVDNRVGARAAVRHLLSLGHRRIGLIGGSGSARFAYRAPTARRAGYREALAEHDIVPDPMLEVDGAFTAVGGLRAMGRLLGLDAPPSAVFAMSDEMAFGAMREIEDHGLRVGHDVAVAGFDDHDLSRFVGLTTVRQDVVARGTAAATMVLRRLQEPEEPPPDPVMEPTRLVVRASTGGPRTRQP